MVAGVMEWMDWEFGITRCKLVYIQWINNKVLLYSTGNYIQNPVIQFIWKQTRPRISKAVLRKKSRAGGINLPDFRLYYKASHQDSMVLTQTQKNRPME